MNAHKLAVLAAAAGLLAAPLAYAQTTEPTKAQDNATQNEGTAALNAEAKAKAMAAVTAGPMGQSAPDASMPASTSTNVPAPTTDTMTPETSDQAMPNQNMPNQNMTDPSATPAPTPLPQEPDAQTPAPTEPKTDGTM